ncbi:MAG: hypothetical protein JWN44_651 [Myxococcales bacterium]|nr:hypothetical protein [Myxococcales bacterium]
MIYKSLWLVPLLAACGFSVPDHASCDGRPQEQACVDLLTNKNSQAETTLKALCVGSFSTSLCDHTGALGGCQCDGCENGKSIEWLFADPSKQINTADDVRRVCANRPYVAP